MLVPLYVKGSVSLFPSCDGSSGTVALTSSFVFLRAKLNPSFKNCGVFNNSPSLPGKDTEGIRH